MFMDEHSAKLQESTAKLQEPTAKLQGPTGKLQELCKVLNKGTGVYAPVENL